MILKWLARNGRSLPISAKLLRPVVWLRGRLNGSSLGVRLILQNGDGQVLLVRHTYLKGWFLPGGGIDPGEPPVAAAKRELVEETGLEALSEPELFGYYLNNRSNIRDYIVCYRIAEWKAPEQLGHSEDGEIAEIGFFDPTDLPDGVSDATRTRIDELVGIRALSDHW